MELKIIEWIQSNFFQYIIYILSYAGHLFTVLGFIAVVYIAVDKKLGAKAFIFYFTSMMLNADMKVWIGRGRPYTQGANTIIEKSTQASMPSGHLQGFSSLLIPFALRAKNRVKAALICAGLILFLAFTRVYLGQHYLSDVLVGAAVGLAVACALEAVYFFAKDKADLFLLILIPVCVVLMCVFNGEAYRDAFVSCGILCGALIGTALEERFVGYEVKGPLKERVLKVLFSLAVTSAAIMPTVLLRGVMPENIFLFILFAAMSLSFTLLCPFLIKKVFERNRQTAVQAAE